MGAMTAKQAITGLNALTLRASDALDGLSRLGARLEFCETVRQVRPALYREYQHDCFTSPKRFHLFHEAFYEHLGSLFPVAWNSFDNDPYKDYSLNYIGIWPQGEMWHEGDPEQIGLSVRGALVIADEFFPPRALADWKSKPGVWSEGKLKAICAKQRTPLRHALLAVLVACCSTGNDWLDTTFETLEGGYLPEMSAQTIRNLAAEWRKAKRILQRIEKLDKWLEADPANRLPQLYQLYQRSRVADSEADRVRVTAMSSADFQAGNRPLIETLPLDEDGEGDDWPLIGEEGDDV